VKDQETHTRKIFLGLKHPPSPGATSRHGQRQRPGGEPNTAGR